MMRNGMILVLVLCGTGPLSAQQTLDFSGSTWTVAAEDARRERYLGRDAVRLRNGGIVLSDVAFENGTIEFDVATTGHRSFVGVAFRMRDGDRTAYEHFYLRPHQTGRFDALQYTPDFGGLSAWQLYPEYNAPVDIPRNEWIHVRLLVSGARMDVYVGDGDSPSLSVDDLRLDPMPGAVALVSNFPEAAALDLYPTAFSSFEITPDEGPAPSPVEAGPSAGTGLITSWALSESLPVTGVHVTDIDATELAALSWTVVDTDPRGRLNIAAHRAFPAGAAQGRVFARVVLRSDEARTVPLSYGFSDRGSVFLNGDLVLTGDNTYRSRSLRYLGVMTVDNDTLFLPLRQGANELVIAVSEAFGGWGLVARIEAQDGVRIDALPPDGP